MSNVRALPGSTVPNEPNPKLIDMLEGLLERAKAGELRGMGYACLTSEGSATTGWTHEANFFALCGAVGYLTYRLNAE